MEFGNEENERFFFVKSLADSAKDKFWSWFIRHEVDLTEHQSADDPILDTLLEELQLVHPEFFFLISTNSNPHEFIVTVEAKRSLFSLVEEFVASAPRIPSWEIIALKPAQGFDFKTTYEGQQYDPKAMWFLPLIKRTNSASLLGLRVGVPNFSSQKQKEIQFATLVLLDTCLGERSVAEDIFHVEVGALPAHPAGDGYIELTELPKYIQWRKAKEITDGHRPPLQ